MQRWYAATSQWFRRTGSGGGWGSAHPLRRHHGSVHTRVYACVCARSRYWTGSEDNRIPLLTPWPYRYLVVWTIGLYFGYFCFEEVACWHIQCVQFCIHILYTDLGRVRVSVNSDLIFFVDLFVGWYSQVSLNTKFQKQHTLSILLL